MRDAVTDDEDADGVGLMHGRFQRGRLFFQAEDGIRDLTVTGVQTCALPIWSAAADTTRRTPSGRPPATRASARSKTAGRRDRKSTRLNSSHSQISYAVFCLKKKKDADRAPGVDIEPLAEQREGHGRAFHVPA